MAAPTFVAAYTPASQPVLGTVAASVTVAAGDTLIVFGSTDDSPCTLATPTGGGLTYTLQSSSLPGTGHANVYVWTAPASSAQTFTLSVTPSTNVNYVGLTVLRFAGVASFGTAAPRSGTNIPRITIDTTVSYSSTAFYSADWDGGNGARTWIQSSGAVVEDGYSIQTGHLTNYAGHYPALGSPGSKTVGLSAPTGQQWTGIALELVGTAGASQSGSLALSASASLVMSGTQGTQHGFLQLSASATLAASGSGTVGGLLQLSASGSLTVTGGPTTGAVYPGYLYPDPGLYPSAGGGFRTPPPIVRPIAPLDMYRTGFAVWYTVDASRGGVPVVGATGMAPTGGSIVDTIKPGVRRTLSLNLAPEPGLYELLKAPGLVLTVTAHVRGTSRVVTDIPMGVFDVDSAAVQHRNDSGGIELTAPDLWVRIQRAKFVVPQPSVPGLTIPQQIGQLIQGALGSVPVTVTATCTTPMQQMVFDRDREKSIVDLATSAACWVYFDRTGHAVVADVPTIDRSASWLADASPSGVLITLDRQASRTTTHNVVVVTSTASSGEAYPTQVVADTDPASPTYAGTDPIHNPGSAGPFGISPYHLDESLLTSVADAQRAGLAILSKTVGVASQISLTQLPNPNIDAFDSIQVLPPRQRSDIPQVSEQHIAETVTHPLDVSQPMQIAGRSTRTDSYS